MFNCLKTFVVPTLVLASLALCDLGCSVKATPAVAALAPGPSTPSADKEATAALNGVWSTGCYQQNNASVNETLTLEGGTFSDQVKIYMGACEGTPMTTATSTGSYVVSGNAIAPAGAVNLDVTITGGSTQPGTYYTIALLQNGQLFLPDSQSTTPNVRPADVNHQRPYTKVGER